MHNESFDRCIKIIQPFLKYTMYGGSKPVKSSFVFFEIQVLDNSLFNAFTKLKKKEVVLQFFKMSIRLNTLIYVFETFGEYVTCQTIYHQNIVC